MFCVLDSVSFYTLMLKKKCDSPFLRSSFLYKVDRLDDALPSLTTPKSGSYAILNINKGMEVILFYILSLQPRMLFLPFFFSIP